MKDADPKGTTGGPAGSAVSTAEDLLNFDRALRDHKLLNAKHTDILLAPKVDSAFGGRYAYGFFVRNGGNGNRIAIKQMKKLISTEPTNSNIAKVMDLLAGAPGNLESLSQRFSGEQLHQPPESGERSFTEVLAHLLNCEARSSEAIVLALLADEPVFIDIHPERQLGKLLRYDLLAFSDLLAYFKLRRTVLLRVLASLTDVQWSRTIREEGKKRKESVYWRARSMAMHELEHLSEIEGKLGGKEQFV